MSNRQSRARKRELRDKVLIAEKAEKDKKTKLFYRLTHWFKKEKKIERKLP
ncbi:hypothetical protein SK355_12235 (plasmid) [Candidatus Fukatsuia symbiotica]|uniref:hypothetical protein n=1 Tax=Candidatus Fukatsuia symbiotica TaxID=1878942 RepID=UPI0013C2F0F4|nr:hypothetical protein [Candidatus Fukatsuia symbiotica]MEA9445938.1 hypothetical protein [Candidatus Fukatsuia symbiotica]